ncbi:SDR family NAD(P)-dependent oxidoreductase [Cedecea neteri]|uniref:Oxidoreductase n=1 Tax=Cedecea neteri TaxID=158822 RepID=A0A291E252_9ENTR|nr:SDR family oxidoreductase [Cedecea neteri]ATF94002.1 oxidoreductase [Cedecea neteri]
MTYSPNLENKIALITGGGSGIGLASARAMIKQGARVIITGRDLSKLQKACAELGPQASVMVVDVTSLDSLSRLMTEIKERVGLIDIVFANAGHGIFKSFGKFTEEDFHQQVDTNFKGVFFTLQKSLPLIRPGGTMLINASWTRHRPMGSAALYAATKAAVANLAQSLAAELADKAIRVNAISPGYVNTPLFNEEMLPADEARRRREEVPLSRFANGDEIGEVVAFLAGPGAAYINGQDLLIDGGMVKSKMES